MIDVILIKSVLGFNTKIEIKDQDGNPIKTGAKTIYSKEKMECMPKACMLDTSFFTHYNEKLLNKIRDYRRIND